MRASEIAHATPLRMLHAAPLGCRWMVEDILDKARAEHGHIVATAAFDEYQLMADAMYTDSERAEALRDLAEEAMRG